MELLDEMQKKIEWLGHCDGAYIMAHATWAACDHREVCGPGALTLSHKLDPGNKERVDALNRITLQNDYNNCDQADMLKWLHDKGFSGYVAKQIKWTKKRLVDWV